jgi:hypothetical protein
MTPDWSASNNPDPVPYADLRNPQSLNLYAYVKNNPTTLTDPNGHCDVDGEHHGWLWCAAHAIGITQTQKEQADAARQILAGLKNMTLNGQTPGGWPRLLISVASAIKWVPRPSRSLRRAGVRDAYAMGWLGRRRSKRNLFPAFIYSHGPSFVQEIETVAAPAPFFGRTHQSALHRVAVHIPELFDALLGRPHVEVVETPLPKMPRNRAAVSEFATEMS